jgi:hypothetical protein
MYRLVNVHFLPLKGGAIDRDALGDGRRLATPHQSSISFERVCPYGRNRWQPGMGDRPSSLLDVMSKLASAVVIKENDAPGAGRRIAGLFGRRRLRRPALLAVSGSEPVT